MIKIVYYLTPKTKAHLNILLSFLIVVTALCGGYFYRNHTEQVILKMPLGGRVIALDPGHGGYDPGVFNSVDEKEVNLEISLILRDFLQQGGAVVVMTREKDMDFLEVSKGPKKRLDMKTRVKIIEDSGADIVISIHCNAMSSSRWSGAQTFYQFKDEESKVLAQIVQDELKRVLKNTDRGIKQGDYYVLANSTMPGIIVEAGFLSNPRETELLKTREYQGKLAWAIYGGIIKYFNRK
ncbi:MAG: N-acetylmuramoyl-L-alanine amidase CwlD [Firmicutes bacterium HGW-Firmicutes-13]|nr:MAG: N-acetylmuramoyl-L-alanine amidase CwlD [Firmicutes bacterium HGW-Firmicutes-13]